jgi:general secretion pathway protein I
MIAPRRQHPRRRRSAFTLVEVLATLVLIGIVIPVAMQGVSVAMTAASNARRTSEAASLAEAKLNQLVVTGEWQFAGQSGDFGAQWPGYRWTVETAQRDYGVTEIALHVTWQERGGKDRSLTLSTLAAVLEDTSGNSTFGAGGLP